MDNENKDFITENTEDTVSFYDSLAEGEISEEAAETPEEDIVKVIKKEKKSSRHRKKKNGVIKSIVWILVVVIVSVIIAGIVIIGTSEYLGIGPGRGKEITVQIDPGMSTRQIASALKDSGAINSKYAFIIYSRLSGCDGKYSYGVYNFNNEIGYEDLTRLLMTQGAKAESVTVTIPEMSTIDEMAAILEQAGVCTASDFKYAVNYSEFDNQIIKNIPAEKVYYRLEGYLFPDTYDFYCYDSKECADLAIKKMLNKMEEVFDEDAQSRAEEMGYTVHEILTMASIVELEAGGSPDEMASVAQVFYNRLDSSDFTTLGSSPTRKYPYGNGKYNTYECVGLPVGPLCAPSAKSVTASLYPNTDNNATYFVTDKSMKFYYNTTLSGHNSTIAKLQRENNWIYED